MELNKQYANICMKKHLLWLLIAKNLLKFYDLWGFVANLVCCDTYVLPTLLFCTQQIPDSRLCSLGVNIDFEQKLLSRNQKKWFVC